MGIWRLNGKRPRQDEIADIESRERVQNKWETRPISEEYRRDINPITATLHPLENVLSRINQYGNLPMAPRAENMDFEDAIGEDKIQRCGSPKYK